MKDLGVSFTLRSSARTSGLYHNRIEFTVYEEGRLIGRIHENPRARPELRWFWSITVPADPKRRISRSGYAATLAQAKAIFRSSWTRLLAIEEDQTR
jgi:hypothetical protein